MSTNTVLTWYNHQDYELRIVLSKNFKPFEVVFIKNVILSLNVHYLYLQIIITFYQVKFEIFRF